ncbi:transposase [Xanthomonas oryzae pv. oryzicola BLS256]|uniref:Transposase n=1 Tax=Xanthomonas oryzae pv. oryzicola (strain BLS256) TaxID=383407 RepID=G7TLW1_XANOB|nr:transposase [Xanthomonas oryzae pv. oryzicola BLS256]
MTTATHAAEPAQRDDGRCHDHCCTSSTDNKDGERDPDMHQTKKAPD